MSSSTGFRSPNRPDSTTTGPCSGSGGLTSTATDATSETTSSGDILLDVTLKPGTRDCVVLAGTLHDLYTGTSIAFMRGQGTSELVQIDHVVPLSFAFQQGAASWDSDRREQFANDFTNLQATDGPTNLSKGDAGPARWMPPAADYRCDYAIRFIDIAASYQLSLPLGDHQALSAQLQDCRDSGP